MVVVDGVVVVVVVVLVVVVVVVVVVGVMVGPYRVLRDFFGLDTHNRFDGIRHLSDVRLMDLSVSARGVVCVCVCVCMCVCFGVLTRACEDDAHVM